MKTLNEAISQLIDKHRSEDQKPLGRGYIVFSPEVGVKEELVGTIIDVGGVDYQILVDPALKGMKADGVVVEPPGGKFGRLHELPHMSLRELTEECKANERRQEED